MFHRLAFNIKRLFEKAPGSITRNIATYATALFLLKEELNMSEESLQPILEYLDMDTVQLVEEIIHIDSADEIVGSVAGFTIYRENLEELIEDIGGDANTVASTGIQGHVFRVPNCVFRKFATGRNKYERWSKYLEDDEEQVKIKKYVQKNPGHTVMLQCEETGAMRAIRRRASNML
jgi:hypothetical protein